MLIAERSNEPFKGYWSIPGWKVHIGESVEAANMREMQEELGLDVSEAKLHKFFQFFDIWHAIVFCFQLRIHDDGNFISSLKFAENEIKSVRWIDRSNLVSHDFFPNHKEVMESVFENPVV